MTKEKEKSVGMLGTRARNCPGSYGLSKVYNVPPIIIDAMLLEDVDKYTWINSRDITVLLDPLQGKQRLRVELGPVERIKPAIEAEKRIRIAWLQSSNSISNEMGASGYYEDERILRRCVGCM
uniref:Uncharacterized protein n=1 Tax=Physcomitrium patens TaxID=3218 RepID=A0A2K1JGP8_PHYPA|nr:hypothetical protein PHYPA_018137 [Physcomitrium patens]